MPIYGQYDVPRSDTMVNMGVGQPDNNKLPLDLIKESFKNFIEADNKEILQYGDIPGYPRFREKLATWLSEKYKNNVSSDSIFITNGNTQAIHQIMTLLMKPGECVITEDPSYFIIFNIFKEFGLDVKAIDIENDGVNIQSLENTIQDLLKKQEKVYFYTIPFNHNPTGVNMSLKKKNELARLCDTYPNFHVISDEVYHFLSWDNIINDYHKPLADYHKNIITCGSFSKILAPSLRLGWIYNKETSNDSIINIMKLSAFYDSAGGTAVIPSFIVEQMLDNNKLDEYIVVCKNFLKSRSDAICKKLDTINTNLGIIYNKPSGGYFIWLNINDLDCDKLLEYSIKNKVKFHQGWKFTPNKDIFRNFIRLSFSFYNEEDLTIGTQRLIDTINNYNKIKVKLQGATGKLGSLIVNQLNKIDSINYDGNISRDMKIDSINLNPNQVIIDVSHAEATNKLISKLYQENKFIPIIIGTTGDIDMEILSAYSKFAPVALISNFSDGIPKIIQIAKELNSLSDEWTFKMIESHHKNKKDKPSGTAITLSKSLNRECIIESIRKGDIVGDHKLVLTNGSEEITIQHKVKDRNIFAKGCIKFIEWILLQKPGIYQKNDLKNPRIRKYSASGNILIVAEFVDVKNWHKFVINEANKDKNLDGVIFLSRTFNKDENQFNNNWSYFNRDGNQVSFCGNGMRCMGKYISENYKELVGNLIDSKNESLDYKVEESNIFFNSPKPLILNTDKTDEVKLFVEQFDFLKILNTSMIVVGVPHIIIDCGSNIFNLDKETFHSISEMIYNKLDKGFNINFVNIIDENNFNIRTFERGVNRETGSCGSGSLASFYYYLNENKLKNECTVNYMNNKKMSLYTLNEKYYLGGIVESINYKV